MNANYDILSIVTSVLIVLVAIATFFLISALKKIDKIAIIEERLNNALNDIGALLTDIKLLLNKNSKLESRIDILEFKIKELEKEFNKLKQGE